MKDPKKVSHFQKNRINNWWCGLSQYPKNLGLYKWESPGENKKIQTKK